MSFPPAEIPLIHVNCSSHHPTVFFAKFNLTSVARNLGISENKSAALHLSEELGNILSGKTEVSDDAN